MQEILDADPDNPRQQGEHEMRLWFQSFDPDAQMPITSMNETDRGTSIAWRVTFKRDVTAGGQTFHAGDTFELDAALRKSDCEEPHASAGTVLYATRAACMSYAR